MSFLNALFGKKKKPIPHVFYLSTSTQAMVAAFNGILRSSIENGEDNSEEKLVFVSFIVSQCYLMALRKDVSHQKLTENTTEYIGLMVAAIQETYDTPATSELAQKRFNEYLINWNAGLSSRSFSKLCMTFMINYGGSNVVMDAMELSAFLNSRIPSYLQLIKNDLA